MAKIFFAVYLLMFSSLCLAQSPDWCWSCKLFERKSGQVFSWGGDCSSKNIFNLKVCKKRFADHASAMCIESQRAIRLTDWEVDAQLMEFPAGESCSYTGYSSHCSYVPAVKQMHYRVSAEFRCL